MLEKSNLRSERFILAYSLEKHNLWCGCLRMLVSLYSQFGSREKWVLVCSLLFPLLSPAPTHEIVLLTFRLGLHPWPNFSENALKGRTGGMFFRRFQILSSQWWSLVIIDFHFLCSDVCLGCRVPFLGTTAQNILQEVCWGPSELNSSIPMSWKSVSFSQSSLVQFLLCIRQDD